MHIYGHLYSLSNTHLCLYKTANAPGRARPNQREREAEAGLRVKQAVDEHLHIVSELLSDVHKKVSLLQQYFFGVPACMAIIVSF